MSHLHSDSLTHLSPTRISSFSHSTGGFFGFHFDQSRDRKQTNQKAENENYPLDYQSRQLRQEFWYKQVAVLLDLICENFQFVPVAVLHMHS